MLCVGGMLSGVMAWVTRVVSMSNSSRYCNRLIAQQLDVSSMGLASGPPLYLPHCIVSTPAIVFAASFDCMCVLFVIMAIIFVVIVSVGNLNPSLD